MYARTYVGPDGDDDRRLLDAPYIIAFTPRRVLIDTDHSLSL